MKNYFIFLATTLLLSIISCTEIKNHEVEPINSASDDILYEYISFYMEGVNKNIQYLAKLSETEQDFSKTAISSRIEHVSNKTTLNDEDTKFIREMLGISSIQELENYDRKLQLLQEQVFEEYPELKQMNLEELNLFFTEQVNKYSLHTTFLPEVENRSTTNSLILRGLPQWNFDCKNTIRFRIRPDTPVEDIECPTGASYISCRNKWENCVAEKKGIVEGQILACIGVGLGTVTFTALANSVVPVVGTTFGFVVGLINGGSVAVFCIEDRFDYFRDVLCVGCQIEFDSCCVE